MVNKGDFAQQANTKHGKEIKDAVIFKTRKGETTTTVIGISSSGENTKKIVVL